MRPPEDRYNGGNVRANAYRVPADRRTARRLPRRHARRAATKPRRLAHRVVLAVRRVRQHVSRNDQGHPADRRRSHPTRAEAPPAEGPENEAELTLPDAQHGIGHHATDLP